MQKKQIEQAPQQYGYYPQNYNCHQVYNQNYYQHPIVFQNFPCQELYIINPQTQRYEPVVVPITSTNNQPSSYEPILKNMSEFSTADHWGMSQKYLLLKVTIDTRYNKINLIGLYDDKEKALQEFKI